MEWYKPHYLQNWLSAFQSAIKHNTLANDIYLFIHLSLNKVYSNNMSLYFIKLIQYISESTDN